MSKPIVDRRAMAEDGSQLIGRIKFLSEKTVHHRNCYSSAVDSGTIDDERIILATMRDDMRDMQNESHRLILVIAELEKEYQKVLDK